MDIALNGRAFTVSPKPNTAADAMGIALAFIDLLFVFRAVWVAVLPISTVIAGVGTSAVAVNVAIINDMAVGAAITVVLTVLAAITTWHSIPGSSSTRVARAGPSQNSATAPWTRC